jgi:4-hydroxy-2-oxoglutarate aldolase
MVTNLSGLFAPVPTPFHEDESIAFEHFEANLQRWISQPLDGVVMPGSNSEISYLSDEEKIQLWAACANLFQGSSKQWIAGTGAERTADTIHLTQEAARAGAAAALVLPPNYYKRAMTHEVLVRHYTSLADQSPIPVLIYNIPAYTGIDFELKTLVQLAEHPNIVGMKDSSSNIVKMAGLLKARPDFKVFAGTGSALLPYLSIGAVGGVTAVANIAAVALRGILDSFTSGQLEEARRLQISLAELNSAVTTRYGVPGLKYAMDKVGFYGGPPRLPLLRINVQEQSIIDHLLKEAGLL